MWSYSVEPLTSSIHKTVKLFNFQLQIQEFLVQGLDYCLLLKTLLQVAHTLDSCLGRVSSAVMKHDDQSSLKKSRCIWLIHPESHSWLWKAKAGAQTRQKHGVRSCCRGHGRVLLNLYLMSYSAYFLLEPTTTKQRRIPLTMHLSLPYQLLIKKFSYRLVCW